MLLRRLQAPFCYQMAKHVCGGGGKIYMNYENSVSLKCGFTAVRVHVMFAAYYCHIWSRFHSLRKNRLELRKDTHICIHALSTPALRFREQRNFRGWEEDDEHSFPGSCGNKVNGASQIDQAQINLDLRKMPGCITLYFEGLLKETGQWSIHPVAHPDSCKVCFSLVRPPHESETGKKRIYWFQSTEIFCPAALLWSLPNILKNFGIFSSAVHLLTPLHVRS